MNDLSTASGLELAVALRERQVGVGELLDHFLGRIEADNPALNAFVRVNAGRARRQVASMERSLAQGGDGIFLGVPTGIKDIDPTAFDVTSFGARHWRYFWSPVDGPVPKRVRGGGFVVLGKLATSEFAVLPVTEPDTHAPARNPHNRDHTPGGSSGGSAAAVAAGLLPIAHGSDGGGSIRIPAAFCGLHGHKASVGLLPDFYEAIDPIGMSQVNALCRTVDDSAAMLDVFRGLRYDPRTPPEDSLLAQSRQAPQRLRIAISTSSPLGEVDPELVAATERAGRALEALGHTVVADPWVAEGSEHFLPVFGFLMAQAPVLFPSLLQPATRYVREQGKGLSRAQATEIGLGLRARVAEWFGDWDLRLSPTTACLPPRVGAWKGLGGKETFEAAVPVGAFTAVFNVGGQAAASVPAGMSTGGLPLGVQLAAPIGRDARLLRVCRELGEALA